MKTNPYPGVNAHLNSWLQTPGTKDHPALFPTFHSRHIAHMCDFLNEVLPDNYVAFTEQSSSTLELTIAETAAVIREVSEQGSIGQIVTQIELLSPANKHDGSGYAATYVFCGTLV